MNRDAQGPELCLWADSRQHQQMWATECAGAEQYFLACGNYLALALDAQLHTHGFFALKQDALGMS
ncbi:hypothetical protein D9M71_129160 [compost metagenome]